MTTFDQLDHNPSPTSSDADRDSLLDFTDGTEHPRVRLPFSVTIDGRSYEGSLLSVVAASATGIVGANWPGAHKIAIFRFNFGSFWLSLPIDVTILAADSKTGAVTLRYREPTGQHMPQLRYILNSWLAGDLIAINGLLVAESSRPKGKLSASVAEQSRSAWLSKVLGACVVTVASAGLFVVAAWLLSDRLFITDVEAPAVVYRQSLTMTATAGGQLDFLDAHAALGKPAYSILASSGVAVTATMPCDCNVETAALVKGGTVVAGQPVLFVSKPGAPLVVRTAFTGADFRHLAVGATAIIATSSGTSSPAKVEIDREAIGNGQSAAVTLVPLQQVPGLQSGSPVSVRLDSTPQWLRSIRNVISIPIGQIEGGVK
ncbi:hypothetical protein [Rhizobium sp. Root1220]|uniref:hypothetical protein n=1 Tax=Rhizobium sp. Root1220 TaxID=1736432 RepID=UPI0006F6E9FD|nr:hypothetical protein [Rhizobium sp. Root1220]KQV70457.1 hypothetical protein ASC90_10190 [Rhizobium sp. Root1220]